MNTDVCIWADTKVEGDLSPRGTPTLTVERHGFTAHLFFMDDAALDRFAEQVNALRRERDS